jgi:hypothetical protein
MIQTAILILAGYTVFWSAVAVLWIGWLLMRECGLKPKAGGPT